MPEASHPPTLESPPGTTRPPRRAVRWVVIALALVIALPVAALAAVALLLPSETIARLAADRAEAALGLPVSIGDVQLDFWPIPSVALVEPVLGDAAEPVARASRVLLRPRLLPLFSGNVTVREITLDQPDIRLVVDAAGALNLPFSGGEGGDRPAGSSVSFAVDEFSVRGGRLAYMDVRDGTELHLEGIEQRLRVEGRFADGGLARVSLDGTIESDSLDALLPSRLGAPLRGIRIALTHSAALDRSVDRLDISRLRIEMQRVALEGSGRIDAFSDSLARSVAVELGTDEFSFEDLARSIPPGFLSELLAGRDGDSARVSAEEPALDYAGRARITARVDGLLTRDSIPRVAGDVRFSDVTMGVRGDQLLADTRGTITFSNESIASSEVGGTLTGAPFVLSFRVDSLAAPVAVFAARGTARVEELLSALEANDSITAAGTAPFDLRGELRPSDPRRSLVEGTVGVGGIDLSLASMRQPIRLESGQVRFAGSELRIEQLALAFGESRLAADATVEGWLPAALGDSTALPMVQFEARAGTLDLDALLGPSKSEYAALVLARLADRPVNGKSAAEAATEAGLALPELPNVRATGSLRADRLIRSGLVYEAFEAEVESGPAALSAPRIRFGFMGGTVDLGLALQRGEREATLALDYHLENVGASSFFSRFSRFQGQLSGLLSLDGEASLQLDEQMLPVRPTVQSTGSIALTSGALANWPVLRAIGERLGVAAFDTLAFREWSGSYLIAGPLVTLERSLQVEDRVQTELAGSFDFGGALDLGVVATLSPGLVARAGEPVRAAARAASGDGSGIPVGLRITGTTADPVIALDLSAARENAIAQVRERATEEAEAAATRAAAEVARRVLGDSVPASPDSLVGAVRSRVQDRLRGLLGGGARSAPADSPAAPADSGSAAADSVPAADSTAASVGG